MNNQLNFSDDDKIAGVPIKRLLRNLEETSYKEGSDALCCRLSDCEQVIRELLATRTPSAAAGEVPSLTGEQIDAILSKLNRHEPEKAYGGARMSVDPQGDWIDRDELIAALKALPASPQPPAAAEAGESRVDPLGTPLNDACWAFIGAMPHELPGPIWNAIKPAVRAAIEKYLSAAPTSSRAQGAGVEKIVRDMLRVLRGVECGDDSQWPFIANVCANADDWLAALAATPSDETSRHAPVNEKSRAGWYVAWCEVSEKLKAANSAIEKYAKELSAARATPSDDQMNDQVMRERDHYHEMADKLAEAVAEHFGADIGEHSSGNCPWLRALDLLNTKPEYIECEGTRHARATPSEGVGAGDGWSDDEPPQDMAVLAYHPDLIDADYNPQGVVEAFYCDGEWTGAIWNNTHDCWDAMPIQVEKWRRIPRPALAAAQPTNKGGEPNV